MAEAKSGSLQDPLMLDIIDKLRNAGVDNYVDLPTVIAVGAQSSGKSSNLEGLTGLPFPRKSDLCTRFMTQVIFARSDTISVSISIRPYSRTSEEHKKECSGFSKTISGLIDKDLFSRYMNHASDIIFSPSAMKYHNSTFSLDVLKIEIAGPDQDHFEVIDIPGLFSVKEEGITTDNDIKAVRKMVVDNMESKRSIILAVVPANVDVATQEIITMARKADPEGIRTLGILTKPDMVCQGEEAGAMNVLLGKKHPLKLGWSMVRNPGQKELEDGCDRHQLEAEFFRNTSPWNTLDPADTSISSLKSKLQRILNDHIKREFPKVRKEVDQELARKREELRALGPPRNESVEQSRFLLDLADDFQRTINAALQNQYTSHHCFSENQQLRLVTAVVARSDKFEKNMRERGHLYRFDEHDASQELDDGYSSGDGDTHPTADVGFFWIQKPMHPALHDLQPVLHFETSDPTRHASWIRRIFRDSKGFELGTYNPSTLTQTMFEQSVNWRPLAMGYVLDVINLVHEFIGTVLRGHCSDADVVENLSNLMLENLRGMYLKAIEDTDFLLQVETKGPPFTLNHSLNVNLQKETIAKIQAAAHPSQEYPNMLLAKEMSNDEYNIQQMHSILKSYYEVARRRFVDNVCMQVVMSKLLFGDDSPLKLFSTKHLLNLTEDKVKKLVGEAPHVQARRKHLEKAIEELQIGKQALSI